MTRLSEDKLAYWLEKSKEYGFLSPQPIEDQIKHSREFINLIPSVSGRVLDLGAGGGLPSLIILTDTDVELMALDSMNKRTDFLEDLRREERDLQPRFNVLNGRAEELSRDASLIGSFDLVVSRGFGPPSYTAECASRFMKIGGVLAVSGRPDDEKARWNEEGLNQLGLIFQQVLGTASAHVALITKTEETREIFPRKPSSIKKSPLW